MAASESTGSLRLTSPAFGDGQPIPTVHATIRAGGENRSIPLEWSGEPAATRSFAFEVEDIHPVAHHWVHWLVSDIPPDTHGLGSGASRMSMPTGAREHENTARAAGWGGPQPPPGSSRHDYVVTLYALDIEGLGLRVATSLEEFRAALSGHVLASARLVGTFER